MLQVGRCGGREKRGDCKGICCMYIYVYIHTYTVHVFCIVKIWDVMLGVNLFVRGPLLSDSLNSCFAAALTCIATIVMFVKLLKAWHLKPPGWPWKRAKRPN